MPRPAPRLAPVTTATRARSSVAIGLIGQPELGLLDLFDVDVLERDHADLLDEARRAIHVPYPRVGQPELEVDLAICVARDQLDAVGEVEPALGLHDVTELPH